MNFYNYISLLQIGYIILELVEFIFEADSVSFSNFSMTAVFCLSADVQKATKTPRRQRRCRVGCLADQIQRFHGNCVSVVVFANA